MRFPSAREVAEKLLCDRCLALIKGDGLYTVKIEEFCSRCRAKMGQQYDETVKEMIAEGLGSLYHQLRKDNDE